jgi:hypothetical protein
MNVIYSIASIIINIICGPRDVDRLMGLFFIVIYIFYIVNLKGIDTDLVVYLLQGPESTSKSSTFSLKNKKTYVLENFVPCLTTPLYSIKKSRLDTTFLHARIANMPHYLAMKFQHADQDDPVVAALLACRSYCVNKSVSYFATYKKSK